MTITTQAMYDSLLNQGWTPQMIMKSYTLAPGVVPRSAQVPAVSGVNQLSQYGREVLQGVGYDPGLAGGGIAGAALAGLGLLGIPTAGLAAAYGVSQAVGVQYPWETGPGEGFIMPWNRDLVKDEQGRWVSRGTRPELFNGGGGAIAGMPGRRVIKTWEANGRPFVMTDDGAGRRKRIMTVKNDGTLSEWAVYKPIVIGKKLTTSNIRRVASRIRSHKKALKKVLTDIK